MEILARRPTAVIFKNYIFSNCFYQVSIQCIKHARHNLLNQGLSDRTLSACDMYLIRVLYFSLMILNFRDIVVIYRL